MLLCYINGKVWLCESLTVMECVRSTVDMNYPLWVWEVWNDGMMDRDKEQRKSRIQEMLRLLQLDSIREKLVRDLSHPQQIMLQ